MEIQKYDETSRRLENDLLARNLKRIDRLSRRGLMLFLDKEISKANTQRLRSKARLVAIRGNGVEVDIDLWRAEMS